jgi:hypothetical protein
MLPTSVNETDTDSVSAALPDIATIFPGGPPRGGLAGEGNVVVDFLHVIAID